MSTYSQHEQSTEQDSLVAAHQQMERADAARQPSLRLEPPRPQAPPVHGLPVHSAPVHSAPVHSSSVHSSCAARQSSPTVAQALQGEDARARVATQQALRNMMLTLDTVAARKQRVDMMMEQLLREIRQVRLRARRRIAWRVALGVIFLYLILGTNGHVINCWWLFLTGGGAAAADERAGKRREATQALYAAGEPRAVGVLAIALRDGDYVVQRVAEQALRDLLPRVQASDAPYINAEQMTALLELAEQGNAHMQRALLRALEQIGDQRAIPFVEYLAANGQTTAVRKQATECLPYLTERVRMAHEQATLLRGSASPGIATSSAQLLRPASGGEETHAEQLLRPTQMS